MKAGDRVAVFSHNGFCRFVAISEVGLSSEIDERTCCKTDEGSKFYMKDELGTGRHYNVGNKAFWIVGASPRE